MYEWFGSYVKYQEGEGLNGRSISIHIGEDKKSGGIEDSEPSISQM